MRNSLENALFAGKTPGDRCDHHCVASQLILFVELPLALLHLEMRIPLPEAGMHAMELSSHLGFLPASALPQIGEFLPEQFYDGSDLG